MYTSHQQRAQQGFIALLSTIIISAILLVMTVEGSFAGWHARFNVLGTEAKEQSSALARGCMEQALVRTIVDPTYGGGATSTFAVGTCYTFPVSYNIPAGTATLRTQAVVRDAYTNLVAEIDVDDTHADLLTHVPDPKIHINSWKEVQKLP